MTADLGSLSVAAVTIGFFHCVCGPDHYMPFVAMSRVGVWSLRKTLLVTLLCGIGHVLGSAVLGFIGVALGLIVFQLETTEATRGVLAGWLFVAFGLAYCLFGVVHAIRCRSALKRDASRSPSNEDVLDAARAPPSPTLFSKMSSDEPRRAATANASSVAPGRLTPWILFALFLFGPCEPLIPLLMYPAAQASVLSVVWVTALFGLTTLITMTALVALIYAGSVAFRFQFAQTYGHVVAGLIVLVCGLAVTYGL